MCGASLAEVATGRRHARLVYDAGMESIGVPVHMEHYASGLRAIKVGGWEEWRCSAAFLQFKGIEGVSEG